MKICIECGRELFDYDFVCDKCHSKNIITEKEYNKIIEEIKHINVFKRKKLLQNHNYKCIYERLKQSKNIYPKPDILKFDQSKVIETDEEYWKRINQHTINKGEIHKLNAPKCPTCGSTNVKRIGLAESTGSIGTLGIFSKKINKTYKCLSCKYTW